MKKTTTDEVLAVMKELKKANVKQVTSKLPNLWQHQVAYILQKLRKNKKIKIVGTDLGSSRYSGHKNKMNVYEYVED